MRDQRYLEEVSAEFDFVTVAEPSLAPRSHRLTVQDDRVLTAVIRDYKAARLKRDAGVGARDVPLGVGQCERAVLTATDRTASFPKSRCYLPTDGPSVEGHRSDQHPDSTSLAGFSSRRPTEVAILITEDHAGQLYPTTTSGLRALHRQSRAPASKQAEVPTSTGRGRTSCQGADFLGPSDPPRHVFTPTEIAIFVLDRLGFGGLQGDRHPLEAWRPC
jgi:hypothetical protein